MTRNKLHVPWRGQGPPRQFRSAVSLHSHTHHSQESLVFLYRLAARVGFIDWAIKCGQRGSASRLDLARGWWTPPLVPRAAWELERRQIESDLGLAALVSLTDHDSIEGPLSLKAADGLREVTVSAEWTVPFHNTFLHLGIHNLPAAAAQQAMAAMAHYTAHPRPEALSSLLRWFHEMPETLIVFNHPFWDEKGIGPKQHRRVLQAFLHRHGDTIHAFELNGLRPWAENLWVLELGRVWNKPVVSGGDRHGLEPNAVLNLSHAFTFGEFIEEVRVYGRSEIYLTEHYRRPLFWRMFDAVLDAVGDHEGHGLGWTRWDDRVFYLCEDGRARPLREIWQGRPPGPIRSFVAVARTLHRSWVQRTLRAAAAGQQELVW